MGSIQSLIQNIRGIPAVPTKAADESDDDDDDEHWEVEVDQYSSADSRWHCGNSENYHSQYIPVEELIASIQGNDALSKLPKDIRHESVLEYIKIQEKLVVRIVTNVRGEDNKVQYFGTGCANISTTKGEKCERPEEFSCPIVNCSHNNGQAHNCFGGLLVYTNKHVIKDNLHAQSCNVDFFYYNENSLANDEVREINQDRSNDSLPPVDGDEAKRVGNNSLPPEDGGEAKRVGLNDINDNGNTNNTSDGLHKGVTVYGNSLRENKDHKDLVGLRILYHDPELYTIVKKYSKLTSGAWSKIPDEIKSNLKKHVIIISHPHGWPKQVSFGNLICLEQYDMKEKHRKVTRYDAATCPGSSGAPVLTGHYPYRPFVHSSKAKFGASFSY